MKVQLTYGSAVEDEDAGELLFVASSDAHGPHIATIPDEFGAGCRMFYTREEIILMKDWCEAVLRRQ